jgi:hypothetical protein
VFVAEKAGKADLAFFGGKLKILRKLASGRQRPPS